MSRICVFGDSIIWGASDFEGGGWTEILKKKLLKESSWEVYSLGVSGDTTVELLERFLVEAEARQPDVIIFAIGLNDCINLSNEEDPLISKERFERNIKKLIEQSEEFTEKILFVSLTKVDESKTTPIPWAPIKNYLNKNIEKYDKIIKEICLNNEIDYIEICSLLKNSDLSDGLYPNQEGHKKIFEKVYNKLLSNKII